MRAVGTTWTDLVVVVAAEACAVDAAWVWPPRRALALARAGCAVVLGGAGAVLDRPLGAALLVVVATVGFAAVLYRTSRLVPSRRQWRPHQPGPPAPLP